MDLWGNRTTLYPSQELNFGCLVHRYQLLVYSDGKNISGDIINTINKSIVPLTDDIKEVGIEVNTEKTKYMSLSSHQIAE
jgi:hypothetical protein